MFSWLINSAMVFFALYALKTYARIDVHWLLERIFGYFDALMKKLRRLKVSTR